MPHSASKHHALVWIGALAALLAAISSRSEERFGLVQASPATELTTPLQAEKPWESGDYNFTLAHQGHQRRYSVHIPPAYQTLPQAPLVLNFHGGGGTAEHAKLQSLMDKKSDAAGFIAVYPSGLGRQLGSRVFGTWNAGRCCGYAQEENIDDVGFVRKMLADLHSRFRIDSRRIYATGMSNGGLFAYRLACELSDEIAAIAPVGAHDALVACHPSRAVPVLHFHGRLDKSAPYGGGQCGGRLAAKGWACRSVPEYMEEWKERNGCSPRQKVTLSKGAANCVAYENCRANATVALCSIDDGRHTWPGGAYAVKARWWQRTVGKINQDLKANDVMWEFFEAHPLEDVPDRGPRRALDRAVLPPR